MLYYFILMNSEILLRKLIYKEKLKKLNIYNFEKKIFYNNLDDILPDFGICFMSAVGELLEPNKEN